ncbi:MAG: hypothetical protein LBU32_08595 [Clostridiales bacterium]|jgi:hypothetical protein|nr:hypothetical protein [Clostridiales bacterium]
MDNQKEHLIKISIIKSFAEMTEAKFEGRYVRADFASKVNSVAAIVRKAVCQNKIATAIVMTLASRCITSPDNLSQAEVDSFTNLLLSSLDGKDVRTENGVLKNIVVMIVNKLNDMPVWFYHDNPNV